MSIQSLKLDNFRNLENKTLEFSPSLNLISGKNASGKTSLLEAVYFLCVGKSFRTRKIENIIHWGDASESNFILFGKANTGSQSFNIGIKREKNTKPLIKVNGDLVQSSSKLAKIIPIMIMDPNSQELISGSASLRRRFLDWGVFHVEHQFTGVWTGYINCLKQRNSLLRSDKIDAALLEAWTKELIKYAEAIDQYRAEYCKLLTPNSKKIFEEFNFDLELNIRYDRGWDKTRSYRDVLEDNFESDRRKKYTQTGPHRADLKFEINNKKASESLSRGQSKILSSCLLLTQIDLLYRIRGRRSVLLIDDIGAELDSMNQKILIDCFNKLKTQVFCTTLDTEDLNELKKGSEEVAMFHVEHGQIYKQTDQGI